ncbi:YheC/YheD family endospore coat-associated protein [Paenibacillus sedimenti]|uniref:YheC/YheD family protein n=1 Tax=Paenibacillus sedimenti TaxID=2770274 RepID=A0A926QKE8_9BACL|nr:YheC/YheD family protein [Paenibacillus sedimenti]MBD0382751.1 YheC/YheD family protein [Paenibacillus sedimenti]
MQTRPLLGIMVTELNRKLPFANSAFYERLSSLGAKEDLDVFVFSPNRIDWEKHTVTGHTYVLESKEWVTSLFPLPSLIYDRCFFNNRASYHQYRYHVRKLRAMPGIRFLGYGLSGKWDVQQILQKDDVLQPHLPETRKLAHGHDLWKWLNEKSDVFLKPVGGSHGKGALHIRKVVSPSEGQLFIVEGRNAKNLPIHRQFKQFDACWQWLRSLIGYRPYLIQQYLPLLSTEGMAYDVRSLVQKNGFGSWENTGMAVRLGKPGSVTSNLHGGGSVEEVSSFLKQQFGELKAEELIADLIRLSSRIPPVLEAHHGRLAELGIDLGIDSFGHIWVLEVNSKPGRTIFAQMRNEKARIKSLSNPIRYAGFLLHKKLAQQV